MYETPRLTPVDELYEAPLLLDLEAVAAMEEEALCDTGGSIVLDQDG